MVARGPGVKDESVLAEVQSLRNFCHISEKSWMQEGRITPLVAKYAARTNSSNLGADASSLGSTTHL